jgi:preprotein translocase subunit SecE
MAAKNKTSPNKKEGGLKAYFRGVRNEMKKVVWPTKDEIGTYTIVVLSFCAVCAVLFWIIDMGVLAGLKNILGITLM